MEIGLEDYDKDLERMRILLRGVLAAGTLAGATFLAVHNVISGDAITGIYGAVLATAGQAVLRSTPAVQVTHSDDSTTTTSRG